MPPELIERFDIIECLSSSELGETYLLLEKDGGKRFVLKCYQELDSENKVREMDFLSELNHKNLPKYGTAIEAGDKRYVLHQYVDGVSLSQYVDEHERLSEMQALGVVFDLCGALSYLHSRPVPIIHRDIKPSNIIINPVDNRITLIDFDISRRFSENSETDTYNFGTKKYSPPEQYGFSQTDCRADIFALGVVLRFMLTGSPDGETQNKRLDRIIKKCTAFSPKDRYKSAEALRRALTKYKNRIWQKTARIVTGTVLLFAMFAVGFTIGRYTEFLKSPVIENDVDILISTEPLIENYADISMSTEPFIENDADISMSIEPVIEIDPDIFIFTEPLIEKAVRLMLKKGEGEPVKISELDDVTEIYIVGAEVVGSAEEYYNLSAYNSYGTIKNLDDIGSIRYLRRIFIGKQPLSDITVLANCELLEWLELPQCPVSDLSPLTKLPRLRNLGLVYTNVSDFSYFGEMAALRYLAINTPALKEISMLEAYKLDYLNLLDAHLTSLDGIERFTALNRLDIMRTDISDFSLLNALPALVEVAISPEMESKARADITREDIKIKVER